MSVAWVEWAMILLKVTKTLNLAERNAKYRQSFAMLNIRIIYEPFQTDLAKCILLIPAIHE
uniref:Uncharacterized protein n=1 Tax=mine drainage metagenome TaxID=410659 RepID=E6QUC4_9ZZZZ